MPGSSRPDVAQILAHPSYPDTLWKLIPTQSGYLPVAAGRGGPFKIHWEVHGKGPIKLVWIMGLGSRKSAWQRQTLKYGHQQGDKYSSLIFDNRGMGLSDKPLMRYSTTEMAKDVLEIFDYLGWTAERELHIAGVSMGGMIAQELAYMVPNRICTLSLISTAARIENTVGFVENLWTRINMFRPKSLDQSVTDASLSLFSERWLNAPDSTILPNSSTPNVEFPESGSYATFSTNYERFAAQELTKRLDPSGFPRKGFMMQAIAAGWHYKSPAQLQEIREKVGAGRIQVLHGTSDNMISVPHGRKLIEWLKPGRSFVKEGVGHVFMLEETEFHDQVVDELVSRAERMQKEGKDPGLVEEGWAV